MAIPDFQTLMLPLLRIADDGVEHWFRDAVDIVAKLYQLSEAELSEMLPSGRAPLFYNRLAWAKTYLKKAGLLELPRRGSFRITERGKQVLLGSPARIDLALLRKLPGYVETSDQVAEDPVVASAPTVETPEESIERAHALMRNELTMEILGSVMKCSPAFFERLVVQLMIKMGYGGSREEAGRAVGKSGDGGIDGIINEDRLGLDAIYLQAKRWDGVVGRPEIMKFVGALAGQRASKGVFITTSRFTQEAKDYASSSQYKVVLIDGQRLADLMIEHDLGVSIAATYQLKRVDSDFFADES